MRQLTFYLLNQYGFCRTKSLLGAAAATPAVVSSSRCLSRLRVSLHFLSDLNSLVLKFHELHLHSSGECNIIFASSCFAARNQVATTEMVDNLEDDLKYTRSRTM